MSHSVQFFKFSITCTRQHVLDRRSLFFFLSYLSFSISAAFFLHFCLSVFLFASRSVSLRRSGLLTGAPRYLIGSLAFTATSDAIINSLFLSDFHGEYYRIRHIASLLAFHHILRNISLAIMEVDHFRFRGLVSRRSGIDCSDYLEPTVLSKESKFSTLSCDHSVIIRSFKQSSRVARKIGAIEFHLFLVLHNFRSTSSRLHLFSFSILLLSSRLLFAMSSLFSNLQNTRASRGITSVRIAASQRSKPLDSRHETSIPIPYRIPKR